MIEDLDLDARSVIGSLNSLKGRRTGPLLLAVDGRSGSGKSTFASILNSKMPATIVSGDDFFAGGVLVHRREAAGLADMCIDRKRLMHVLELLKSGKVACFVAFDWDRFDGSLAPTQTCLQPQSVLILEGVYAYHPELRHLVDFSVLMEVPEAERRRRLLEREGKLTAWEHQWHRAEEWYFANLSKSDHFDMVIVNA